MKNILCFLFFCILATRAAAQELPGLWYSSDSTRIYEITADGEGKWKAVIHSSTRKDDKPGYEIARQIVFNSSKKRFEGFLFAVGNDEPVFTTISFDKANPNKIKLKLERMFLLDVKLQWYRVNTATAIKH